MAPIPVGSNLYVFSIPEQNNHDAVIWAHGVKGGPAFTAPGKTIHFYVADEMEFNFMKGTTMGSFERFKNSQVLPVDTYRPGSIVPNYRLKKAAETHLDNENARMKYAELEAVLRQPGRMFDIVSVRNRLPSAGTTLKVLVNETVYREYHCYFCRARADGSSDGRIAAQALSGRTQFHDPA